jgi:lysophospholipase L1-like esterase
MTSPRRVMLWSVTTLLAVAGLFTVGALPVSAATPRTLQYVALGDSYAAGQGAGRYLNSCLQSDEGYPTLLDSRKHLHLRADASCSGATTSDVVQTQLSALNRGTRVVTLTVGGNDLGVGSIATACADGPTPACQSAIENAVDLLETPGVLARRLADTYAAVAAASPRAVILVTGYPYLFEPPTANNPNAATIVAINDATTALNRTIEETVATAHTTGLNIQYVDVTEAFAGHGIGSSVPFINASGPDAFHPNEAGYAAYAAALNTALP